MKGLYNGCTMGIHGSVVSHRQFTAIIINAAAPTGGVIVDCAHGHYKVPSILFIAKAALK